MMAVTETCVTPTDLAAFMEGSLTGEERDRTVRHLNHCPDCFERYIGAARLLDAIEEEEALALWVADGNRAVDPSLLPGLETLKKRCRKLLLMPISLPWRSRRHAWLLPLAAILAFVGVAHLRNAYLEDLGRPAASQPSPRAFSAPLRRLPSAPRGPSLPSPGPELSRVFPALPEARREAFDEEIRHIGVFPALPEARREAFDEEIRHIVRGHQGNGPEGMTCRRQAASRPIWRRRAFQLGARWVDLDPALRSQSTTLTERALRNLREVLPGSFPDAHCSRLLFPQAPEPKEIDACRKVIELVFRSQPEFALGRWTEATRLAIAAGTDRYFTHTSVREFPERLLEFEEIRWDDGGVRAELERAGKLLEGGLSPGEGEALEAVLQDLACFYEIGE